MAAASSIICWTHRRSPASRIIATTRDPANLADLAARGVTVRAADFDDQASLAKAFAGADRVLIISTDELDGSAASGASSTSGGGGGQGRLASAHLLYTSMPNPEPVSPVVFAPDHYGTEQAIKASGIPYTIFRNGWYDENLFMALPQMPGVGPVVHLRRRRRASPMARATTMRRRSPPGSPRKQAKARPTR